MTARPTRAACLRPSPRGARSAALLLALALGACVGPLRRGPAPPSPWNEWPTVLADAKRLAAAGRYPAADTVLASFVRRWRGAAEADEGLYWQVLLKLDPSNTAVTPRDLLADVDAYLASAPSGAHRDEMVIFRRTAVQLQSLAAESAAARAAPAVADKAKEEELAKLKDELAKTQAELERIRKRVTGQKP